MTNQYPAFVPIKLGDLLLGEEFQTCVSGAFGRVLDWGYVNLRSEPPGPERHKARGVRVEYMVEGKPVSRVHSPDMTVLVPSTRLHWRHGHGFREDTRFTSPLPAVDDAEALWPFGGGR